jgi:hypothetical protein
MSPRAHSCWRSSPSSRSLFDVLRAWSPPAAFAGAGLVLGGCGEVLTQTPDAPERAALADQQSLGWSVGGEGDALLFPDAQLVDVSGGVGWREAMPTLATRLQPGMARWAPYYSPALFQSLEAPRSAELRLEMRPIFTPEMALAERRGQALLSLLTAQGVCRNDVAVVLDLAGAEAVAVASALAHCFDPVFVFDNWPHPRGVAPAHLTLASTLYLLPTFERERSARVAARALVAPVFVLDRARAAPYVDDADQFDNRYFASLPPPDALRAAGIRHVLYVTPTDHVTLETDDLNDDLVALDAGGVDVRMLALSDFSETPLSDWQLGPSGGCAPVAGPPAGGLYFGGTPQSQSCFSFWYGWEVSLPGLSRPAPPQRLLARCHFHPQPRATFAAGAGFHGHAAGWRAGVFGFSRSGSLGRVHSGGFG